jgi:hypothetical protein
MEASVCLFQNRGMTRVEDGLGASSLILIPPVILPMTLLAFFYRGMGAVALRLLARVPVDLALGPTIESSADSV